MSSEQKCSRCGEVFDVLDLAECEKHMHASVPIEKPFSTNPQPAMSEAETAKSDYLAAAIRKHRDQRGDDRCWMDDEELYKALPEGYTPPPRDSAVEIQNCVKFIQCRNNPATEYVSPEREIESLRIRAQQDAATIKGLREALEKSNEALSLCFGRRLAGEYPQDWIDANNKRTEFHQAVQEGLAAGAAALAANGEHVPYLPEDK